MMIELIDNKSGDVIGLWLPDLQRMSFGYVEDRYGGGKNLFNASDPNHKKIILPAKLDDEHVAESDYFAIEGNEDEIYDYRTYVPHHITYIKVSDSSSDVCDVIQDDRYVGSMNIHNWLRMHIELIQRPSLGCSNPQDNGLHLQRRQGG